MTRHLATLTILILLTLTGQMTATAQTITTPLWTAYKAKFMDGSGRIVDNANDNISHSEGQGYGLLLAYLADSPSDFEQIWYFTRTELLIRDDGLAAWKWEPGKSPHVTDINDATDGDLLIAYALALAGSRWKNLDYVNAAASIARSLLQHAVITLNGRTVLLPAVDGFARKDRPDGPVINPSYWVFEAFPIMNVLAPSEKWSHLSRDGLSLLREMKFGPRQLPAEWISLARQPRPADGFEAQYGYNALRIPLYLMRSGITDKELLARFTRGWAFDTSGGSAIIDLTSGRPTERLTDRGYAIINHVAACVTEQAKLPIEAQRFEPVLYYPSTLHLLALAFLTEKHPECL